MSETTRLIPLTRWPDFHPWPSVPALRDYVFHSKSNGFDDVIVRIGRRVLLSERDFFVWAEKHRVKGAGEGKK